MRVAAGIELMGWADRRYDEPKPLRNLPALDGAFGLVLLFFGVHLLGLLLVRTGAVSNREWLDALGFSIRGFASGSLWQPLTAGFLHSTLLDLILASLLAVVAGRLYESLRGALSLWAVFLSGSAASFFAAFLSRADAAVLAYGSRGGLTALVVMLLFLAPRIEINLYFISVRMMWFGGIFLAAEIYRVLINGGHGLHVQNPWWGFVGSVAASLLLALAGPRVRSFGASVLGRRRMRRERKRDVARIEEDVVEERELDRILDKISASGMGSLTEAERQFLKRASERLSRRS